MGLSFLNPIATLAVHGALAIYYCFDHLPAAAHPVATAHTAAMSSVWSRLRRRDESRSDRRPLVNLYGLGDALIIETTDRTMAGYHVATDRVSRLSAAMPDDELGSRILDALNGAREGVPALRANVPAGPRVKALVEAAGRRSYAAVIRDAVLVHVQWEGERLRFTPTRNGGPTGPDKGFHGLGGEALSSSNEPATMGRTARAALELAARYQSNSSR